MSSQPPIKPDFLAIAASAIATAPSDRAVSQAAAPLEAAQREARLTESGIRGAITDADVAALVADDIGQTHALVTVQRWLNARSSSSTRPLSVLVLVGQTGRGKTVAGAWLLARIGGRYVTAETLRRVVVSTHFRDSQVLEHLLNSRCVVLDDAGGEHDANSAAAAMFELVNRRAGHARAWTLITSNLPKPEFCERYGERTVRRIEHQGAIVEVSGADLRRKP